MQSVSTKTGDKGESGLANGQRLGKDEFIFEVLGTTDELNSWLGLVIAKLSDQFLDYKEHLLHLQDTLFYVGAELARSPKPKLSESELKDLEKRSEELQRKMAEGWTSKFIYPGGTEAAATIDIARTVARKLERLIVKLSREQAVSPTVFKYANRLSDYLFVLRCWVNHQENYQELKFQSEK